MFIITSFGSLFTCYIHMLDDCSTWTTMVAGDIYNFISQSHGGFRSFVCSFFASRGPVYSGPQRCAALTP